MNTRGRRIGRGCCYMGASLFDLLLWVSTDSGLCFLVCFLLVDTFGMIY